MIDDLSKLTDQELLDLYKEEKRQVSLKNGGQQVRKILLNSVFGVTAHVAFVLYDIRLAESITKCGQMNIKWVARTINEYLNDVLETKEKDYVCAIDTDSCYVMLEDLVNKCRMQNQPTDKIVEFIDAFYKKYLGVHIDKGCEELAEYANTTEQLMNMDREAISDSSFWVAKKRYAMSVWDMEGVRYNEPYYKIMGLDCIKSSSPQVCRDAMKETIKLILGADEGVVQKYVREFKKEFKNFNPHEIAFPRGVKKLEESYCNVNGDFRSDVTVPINSRASINYNNEIKKLGLTDYELIRNGDKMKFIYLSVPNKLQQNVIGMVDELPKEFNLDHKIDYKTQFFKTYLKPIDAIMQVIGWEAEPTPNLFNCFVEKKIDIESVFDCTE